MYFSSELFVKRGPLGHLWLAGTVFHKLSKKVILSCNIPEMCNSIKQPPIPLALPARAQLFLGVCRIIDKQAKYLLIDATEAQSRVQLAVSTSSVNLTSNRAHAKSDTINIVCDVDDYVLPPIPLDCFETILEHETALFLRHSNPEDICHIENHNLLDNSYLDIDTNLPPQDTMVGLEKTLFDPLAVLDGSEAVEDPNQNILAPEFHFADDPLPEIMFEAPSERVQSQGSAHSKATADTFNVSVISRKRKRNRPKPDSKIDINIDVLKHELADTSRIVTTRPKPLEEVSILMEPKNPLRSLRSSTVCELSDALQDCYEKESHREFSELAAPQMEIDYEQPPVSPDEFQPIIEANDDNLSFKSGDISIERARHDSFLSIDQNRVQGNTFLGHDFGLGSPGVDSLGSDVKASPQQMRRVSMKSLGSLESKTRRLSAINETGASDFQTPDLNLTLSQFDIPHVEIKEVGDDRPSYDKFDRATEILRGILDEHFRKIQGTQEDSTTCQFHSVIEGAVGSNVRVSRRDAALSFFQLLVLKSIGMVTIEQTEPYGLIEIARTSLFSSNTPCLEALGA